MQDMRRYSVSRNSSKNNSPNNYLIFDGEKQVLKNHLGTTYPPLFNDTAEILVAELNEIIAMDTYLVNKNDTTIALSPEEVINHPNYAEIRKKQEMQSFSVCVHNTLLAIEDFSQFKLPIQELIQWDLLYRMSPGPIEKMEQVHVVFDAIQWLGKDWIDLPANYTGSLEEMTDQEVPFVPANIQQRLQKELLTMSQAEQIAVWYLYEFFQQFSITLPILWVMGIISSTTLEDSYYVLASDFSPLEIRDIRKKEGDFVQRRLEYLRRYLESLQYQPVNTYKN